ncbi:MAG: protocatechuate 3,4-dioxygenase [Chloroflexi bacterium]|nr:protocatechuate 3,4-dioxygenase [Chloroflexota bacterium]
METRLNRFVRRPTPEQPQGPFYPLTKPPDADADLTFVRGKPCKAQGQVIHVMGKVLDLNERPIPGAQVEIWQANTFGRYIHPLDTNPAPLDPNFKGYGVQTTDAEGRYMFKTIKPGPYPISEDRFRTRHIHFCVTSTLTRLITQLYFEGEPLNETDPILPNTMNKEDLVVKLTPPTQDIGQDALIAVWDIILWQS